MALKDEEYWIAAGRLGGERALDKLLAEAKKSFDNRSRAGELVHSNMISEDKPDD